MKHLQKAWNNFKVQPEIWFFYGFLLTSMLSVRKVLGDHFLGGSFNEYTSRCIYLSDLFLIAALAIWLVTILYNKNIRLSISRAIVSRRRTFYALGIFLAWALISINWATRPELSYFKFLKLFELGALFAFLSLNEKCSTRNILRNVLRIIILLGVVNSLIGVGQFVLQHSVGLFWLKESLISPDIPGVAKIVLGGQKYIRIYGLFPHPNILGGFLMLSILATLSLKKSFYTNQSSLWNIFPSGRGTLLRVVWVGLLGIQLVGLILTFSKSAILGLLLALVWIWHMSRTEVSLQKKCSLWNILSGKRGTENKPKMAKIKLLNTSGYLGIGFFCLVLGIFLYALQPNWNSLVFQSFQERLLFLEAAKNMILTHPLAGVGLGQFVPQMQNYLPTHLLDWQYQPVHNVFLLAWAETGIIGLFGLLYFLWTIWKETKNVPRGTFEFDFRNYLKAILVSFVFIALFDHYLWDIQQGQIMIWLVVGLLAGGQSKS